MKASEARALSDRMCSNGMAKVMEDVVARIKSTIEKGYRSTCIYTIIPSQYRLAAVSQLKEWGYTVSEGYDPRDSTSWITVSW
jgi:adenosine deaminase